MNSVAFAGIDGGTLKRQAEIFSYKVRFVSDPGPDSNGARPVKNSNNVTPIAQMSTPTP